MKRTALTLAIACLGSVNALSAHATNTDPFDFDYEIVGGITERPALVFNDGSQTFIQPRAGQVITAEGGHAQGPYIVVDGTPEVVRYSVGGHAATARWNRMNTFIGTTGSPAFARDDQPPGFDGFTNRLVLIGSHAKLEPVRNLNATMPVGGLVKALVPQGWTGSAQKDVDLNGALAFSTRDGDNWMQALDRLMTQSGLYADIDFDARHVRLHRDAPKSGALNYAAGEQHGPGATGTVAVRTTAAPAQAMLEQTASEPSQLAQKFGAQAIRDADELHTQIRFAGKPEKPLRFTAPDGKSLRPKWDDAANVVTIERALRFTVSDGASSVEIGRIAGAVYDFPAPNAAGLESVFDEGGQTYFKFADSVVHASVADVRHMGTAEQKGRYVHFSGVAEQFIVQADGNTVNVIRRKEVKYFEPSGRDPAPVVTPTRTAAVSP